MKLSRETKILIIFAIIYFFLAWILTSNYLFTHEKYVVNGYWETWHEEISSGAKGIDGDSNQFRLVSYWMAEGTINLFDQSIFSAYLINRFVVTFIIFCIFHLFLLKWFDHKGSFLGVIILAAITPITYMPLLQESDVFLQLFFLIGLWLIRENKWIWLIPLLFLSTFAKETIIFLLPFYLILNWSKEKKLFLFLKSIVLVLSWGVAFYITRNLFFESGENSPLWQLPHNIDGFINIFNYSSPFTNMFLLFIPLFGMMWVLSFWNLKKKPHFFRSAALFILIFMIIHFLMGWPEETRILLPLAFLIIPSSMLSIEYLLDKENK